MAKIQKTQGLSAAFVDIFPIPIKATANPAATDVNYDLGQVWVNTSSGTAYILTALSSGTATWALASPGASDVDTLTGDSGGAISPAAGNITLAGGTNIASVGAGNTITFNLDAAITLVTSVTSPLYTAGAGVDVAIDAPTGQDVIMTLGDNGGTNKFSILDSDSVEVFAVDSDGAITFSNFSNTGTFTTSGGTASINASSNFNTVINSGTSTGSVTIGNSSAGAVTVDSGAGISLDAAAASNFSVSGAGIDIDIASAAGRLIMTSGEDAADSIYLHADAGTSETIRLHSDQGTGAASVHLESDVGGVTLTSGLASADAINLSATAGGVDVDGALQVNIASSQNAADAVRINASAGGIDIDAAGAAGEDITLDNAAGSIVVTAAEAIADSIVLSSTNGGIDILAPGAGAGLDIDIINTGGSVNVSATEADAAAISLQAASGGLDIDTGLAIIADAAGNVEINSSAGTILIGDDDVDQNIELGTDGEREVTVGSTNGAAGLTLQAGTGNIATTGTFEGIDTKVIRATGIDYTFSSSPSTSTAANTGGVATGSGGDINMLSFPEFNMEQFMIGTQTIIKPTMDNSGLLCSLDLTNTDGVEYNFGAARTLSEYAFTIGTSAAFFFEVTMTIADISGGNPYIMGFRKAEANNATYSSYTDYYALGMIAGTSATNITLTSELNGGGQTLQDSGDAWTGGDGGTTTLRVLVSAAGVVTATIDGGAPSTPLAYTFDNTDVVCPFIHLVHNADAGAIHLVDIQVGFQ
jgi:hypothetical protein